MKSALPLHCIFTSPCSHARFRTLIIWNAADMLFKTNNVLMQLEKNCIPTQMFTTKKSLCMSYTVKSSIFSDL